MIKYKMVKEMHTQRVQVLGNGFENLNQYTIFKKMLSNIPSVHLLVQVSPPD